MKKPEVSVIIPVFNGERYMRRCLQSVAAQTAGPLEVVLVDDCSTDSGMDIARSFAETEGSGISFVFGRTPCNSGPGAARNLGLSLAGGEWVAFLDVDDTLQPDFCSKLLQAARSAGTDLACCDILISGTVHRNPDTEDKRHFLRHFIAYFTTFLYRRQMLLERELFFPCTTSAEDTCFLTCCVLAANGIAQVKEPLYNYLTRDGSLSRCRSRRRAVQRLSSIWKMIAYAKTHGLFKPYSMEIKIIAIKKGYLMALRDLIRG